MSAPGDVNVRIGVTANTAQVNEMFTQIRRLTNTVKILGKTATKLSSDMKKLGSRMDTTNSKVKKLNKTILSQSQRMDRAKSSAKKLTSAQRGYGAATDKMTKSNKRGNTSLGFTGLAFGFIGGIAGFAATQIRTKFIAALEETASLMSEISRINLFSDVGIVNGVVNITALEKQTKRVFDLARETGILTSDIATIIKEVEKAAPASLDTQVFAEMVVGMKLLENTLDASTISADIITIQSNFEELDLSELIDTVFAFGKANKLSFSASAKALGFAAQNAKIFNSDLVELSTIITIISNKIPGFQGNAGRALRRLSSALQLPETIRNLRSIGIELINSEGRFIGLDNALELTTQKFKELDAENQEVAAGFLRGLKFSENARLAFLAFADASDKVKDAAAGQFKGIEGNFQVAVEFQKTTPEAVLGIFKNQITELKVAFTTGLFPAISDINDILKEAFAGGEIISVLKVLGKTIGEDMLAAANVFIPIIKLIGSFLASASPIVQLLAKAFSGLFLALSTITIAFPMLGFFFALIFLHEKLITRSVQLGTSATFVTKSYVRLTAAVSALNVRFRAWLVSLKAGNLSMGILSKQGVLNLRKSLIALGIQIKVQVLAWGVFAKAAIIAAISTARAWIIALLPLAIAIAAFLALIFLANRYKESLLGVVDQLDKTGKASDAYREALDQINALLAGDPGPFFDPVLADLAALEAALGRLGDVFRILFDDLGKSEIFQGFVRLWEKFTTNIDDVVTGIDDFVNSLIIAIPEAWNDFLQVLFNIWNTFATAKLKLDDFIESLNLQENPVWQKLQEIFQGIIDILEPILTPLNAFIDALDFKFPDVLKQVEESLQRIADNPLIRGGFKILEGAGEIGGIIGNFFDNLFKEEPETFFNRPGIDIPELDTRLPNKQTLKQLLKQVREGTFRPGISIFDQGLQFEGNFPPKFKSEKQIEQDRLRSEEFRPQLDLDFGSLPPLLTPEVQEALATTTGTFVTTLSATNIAFEESAIALGNSAVLLQEGEENIGDHSAALVKNTGIVDVSTGQVVTQIQRLFGQIVEIIKNTNALSALTTMIAEVNLAFTKLVAQGNRAAGKLASLRVSTSGKFSITDPGISASDQAAINAAAGNLADTLANQVNIAIPTAPVIEKQTNTITINPTITINNAEGLDAAALVDLINVEFAKTLQKNISQIVSV